MYHQCFKMVNKISNINLQFMNTKAYSKYYCFLSAHLWQAAHFVFKHDIYLSSKNKRKVS